MSQTAAIFVDAYRELNARKMFWVTLILTALFVLVFAMLAPDGDKMHFFTYTWDVPNALAVYKVYFLDLALVGIWLSWVAVILALVSTAGFFPDFISGGSIDLYLSKPIGRLRLFLTKYAAALLFVLLQATVFAVLAFVVVGIRAGEWKWGLFLTIPIVVLFYSYLYAICVLFGVWTRSGIAALLLTMLIWAIIATMHYVEEKVFLSGQQQMLTYTQLLEEKADRLKNQVDRPSSAVTKPAVPFSFGGDEGQPASTRRERALQDAQAAQQAAAMMGKWEDGLLMVKAFFPKTAETVNLMSRQLFDVSEYDAIEEQRIERLSFLGDSDFLLMQKAQMKGKVRVEQIIRGRSLWWVMGSSLLFEVVILSLAGWIFCRRDY